MNRSLHMLGGVERPRARPAPMPLLAKGFRPFFLLAALYAIAIVPLWLAILQGMLAPVAYLAPSVWHAHEMLSGFVTAVVAGFLLTAVGNWTQRETLTGGWLAALALLWVAGRWAMLFAGVLPWGLAAAIDLAFLPALALGLARPLIASNNRRNFAMLGILAALFGSSLVVHLDGLALVREGSARLANLVALDVVVLLISIIGGRVFPMFTRNASGVASIRSIPWLDRACIVAMVALVMTDSLLRDDVLASGVVAGVAGVLSAARAVHWGARHSLRDPLLWILHVGYGWVVVGLLLRAADGIFGLSIGSAAIHALTLAAIGSLTLGMMARVALGHTGRMLAAPAPMTAAFVAITLAALARTVVPMLAPGWYAAGLVAAGVFWTLAFAVYLGTFAPLLLQPRADGKPG